MRNARVLLIVFACTLAVGVSGLVAFLVCRNGPSVPSTTESEDMPFTKDRLMWEFSGGNGSGEFGEYFPNEIHKIPEGARAAKLLNATDHALEELVSKHPNLKFLLLGKFWIGSGPNDDTCTPKGIALLARLQSLEWLEISLQSNLTDCLLDTLADSKSLKEVVLSHCGDYSLEHAVNRRPGFFRVNGYNPIPRQNRLREQTTE